MFGALADGLRGEERLEDPRSDLVGDARALVLEVDAEAVPVPAPRDADGAALRHRLQGVVDEVGHHLLQLRGIDPHRGQVRCEVEDQLGVILRGLGPHEADDLRELLGDIDASDRAAADARTAASSA